MTRMCPAHPAEAVRGAAKPETAGKPGSFILRRRQYESIGQRMYRGNKL